MVSGLGVTCAMEAQPPPRAYEECANNHFNYSVLRGLRANQSVSPASLHNCKYEVLVQHGTNFLVSCKIGPVPSIHLESKRWTFWSEETDTLVQCEILAGQIYVFCALGCNRSVAVVIALLMAIEGLSLDAALTLAREKRPAIRPKHLGRKTDAKCWATCWTCCVDPGGLPVCPESAWSKMAVNTVILDYWLVGISFLYHISWKLWLPQRCVFWALLFYHCYFPPFFVFLLYILYFLSTVNFSIFEKKSSNP